MDKMREISSFGELEGRAEKMVQHRPDPFTEYENYTLGSNRISSDKKTVNQISNVFLYLILLKENLILVLI